MMQMPRLSQWARVCAGFVSLALLGGCAEFSKEFGTVGEFFSNFTVETENDETVRQAMAESRPDVSPSGWYSVNMRVARTALKHKNYKAAVRIYRKVHDVMPQRIEPLLGLGDALFGRKSFGEAANTFRKALVMQNSNHHAQRGLGEALVRNGDLRAGISHLEMALATGKEAGLFNKLAVAHEMAGSPRAAQAYYRSGLALHSDDLALRNNLALSLALSGDHADAVRELEQVLKHPSATPGHRSNLAFVYGMAGNFEAAARFADKSNETKIGKNSYYRKVHRFAQAGDRSQLLAMLNIPKASAASQSTSKRRRATSSRVPVANASASRREQNINANRKPVSVIQEPVELAKSNSNKSHQKKTVTIRNNKPIALTPRARMAALASQINPAAISNMVPRNTTVSSRSTPGDNVYRVQIGAYRDKVSAERGRNMLTKMAPDLLDRLEIIVKADQFRSGIDYRLRTTPTASRGDAERLCGELSSRGIQCLVIKHLPTAISNMVPRNTTVSSRSTPGDNVYRVQIGAYRDKVSAERGRNMLTKMAPDLLDRLEIIVKADQFRSGIDYRLRTTPTASRGDAERLCGELNSRGIQCLVIKHLPTLWNRV